MDGAAVWQRMFCEWPADLPRRGIIVTAFGEQIPFDGFQTGPDLLLVDRKNPDTLGARKIVLAYSQVLGLKIVDVMDPRALAPFGFAAPPSPTAERRKP